MARDGRNGSSGRRPIHFEFPGHLSMSWPHQGHRLWAWMPHGFWVYTYKVQMCSQQGSHDWMLCPYAHRGERARRRDPRRFPYLAVSCPDFRASQDRIMLAGTGEAPTCERGLHCLYAHGVFELWLHPRRFRTRMCDAGLECTRLICFFAHYPTQRRQEDDPVPFLGVPWMPLALPSLPPPRLSAPSPPDHVVVAPVSSLPRPGMMLQTRSGNKIPLHISDGNGAASSSSQSSTAAVGATPPVVESGSSSSLDSSGSSNNRPADEDEEDDSEDDFADFEFIKNIVNLVMTD